MCEFINELREKITFAFDNEAAFLHEFAPEFNDSGVSIKGFYMASSGSLLLLERGDMTVNVMDKIISTDHFIDWFERNSSNT